MADVVELSGFAGIVTVTMNERSCQNTFSPALVEGLLSAFAEINRRDDVRVVVLTGYGNYFCCGGTRDELMTLHEGRRQFDEMGFYRLLLDCRVPVISAMQGHAVGAGLAFGCYADLIVMAEESLYSASFMKYGFTPGFGSTWVIPHKLGAALGAEMLLTARNYHGGELRQRGVGVRVVRRAEVVEAALAFARELSDKPVIALHLLKAQLAKFTRSVLPQVVAEELAMHEQTFKRAEVKHRIEALF